MQGRRNTKIVCSEEETRKQIAVNQKHEKHIARTQTQKHTAQIIRHTNTDCREHETRKRIATTQNQENIVRKIRNTNTQRKVEEIRKLIAMTNKQNKILQRRRCRKT